jgi:hypothetical protein
VQVPDLHHPYVWVLAEQTAWYKAVKLSPSANDYYSDKYLSDEVRQRAAQKVPQQAQIALSFGQRGGFEKRSTAITLKPKRTVSFCSDVSSFPFQHSSPCDGC